MTLGMADFAGRAVLVTGASGGIGAATVRRLASQGATVYAGGRDAEKLTRLCGETGAQPVAFDLVIRFPQEIGRQMTRIDVLDR